VLSRILAPGVVVFGLSVFSASTAAARIEFPEEMREVMQLDCNPTCLLCHTTETGGKANLNGYGKMLKNTEGFGVHLPNGIERVFGEDGAASMVDTDGDLTNDRQEIINNTDPRTEEEVGVCSEAIYGCGAAQVAPGATPRTSAWAVVAALGVALLLLRQLRV